MAEILDLTKVFDAELPIYTSGSYSDPPFRTETWCTIEQQGYTVSRICMGTQTGTHIDAPAHFSPGGATLEALPLQALIGRYLWVDLCHVKDEDLGQVRSRYKGETILFMTSSDPAKTDVPEAVLLALLKIPCLVWVIVHAVQVNGHDPLYFHQALSAAGRYLIEDLDEGTARQVTPGGEMIALPLRLTGVSGSPCRVAVIQS